MINQQKGIELILRELSGNISPEEQEQLTQWLRQSPSHRRIYEKISSGNDILEKREFYDNIDTEAAFNLFRRRIDAKKVSLTHHIKPYVRYIAAAVVACLLIAGVYYLSRPKAPTDAYGEIARHISGRESKATLILDDGRSIDITSSDSDEKIEINESQAIINSDNRIDYRGIDSKKTEAYNTLTVPRGGEYTITLADGTTVHLNSASKLKYPIAFKGDLREVMLEGEAYFIISKDPKRPFIVRVNGIEIRQYGTEFNINTHRSDRIEVALVEGSIGINLPKMPTQMIKPSQLASYTLSDNSLDIKTTDLSPYTSWHRGELFFNNSSMDEIVTTLSRWYGVDIIIEDKEIEKLHFTGRVTRYDKIDIILRALEKTADISVSFKDNNIHINKSYNN